MTLAVLDDGFSRTSASRSAARASHGQADARGRPMIRLTIVRGRVQGVGYRYFVLREAEALGVTGFARNLPDGRSRWWRRPRTSVLQLFEERLRQGPSFAEVDGRRARRRRPRGDQGFHIR